MTENPAAAAERNMDVLAQRYLAHCGATSPTKLGEVIRDFSAVALGAGAASSLPAWAQECVRRTLAAVVPGLVGTKDGSLATDEENGSILGGIIELLTENAPGGWQDQPGLSAMVDLIRFVVPAALADAVALPSERRRSFFAGLSRGLRGALDQPFSLPGLNEYSAFFLLTSFSIHEVGELKSTSELHAWFNRRLGANTTGDLKRVQRFSRSIGLRFRGRGRPPKK